MKLLKWIVLTLLTICTLGTLTYFLGPKVDFGVLEDTKIAPVTFTLAQVDSLVQSSKNIPNLKPDNESRIFWADSIPARTNWSIVYLHGFSASPEEGDPVYVVVGKRYGMNVYVPILPGHGLQSVESFESLTPNQLILAAKQAIQVGNSIGDSLLLMSCSTGSTLALYLAGANTEYIDAMALYSPNIELADQNAKLLTGPWGKELAYQLIGKYKTWKKPGDSVTIKDNYWTTTYRIEGILALQALLSETMTPEIQKSVGQPYFLGYYYKNDIEKDNTISIDAIQRFDKISGTKQELKRMVAFPNVGAHVMTSSLQSKDVTSVIDSTNAFIEQVLKITPKY